jgi:hypothetical protein
MRVSNESRSDPALSPPAGTDGWNSNEYPCQRRRNALSSPEMQTRLFATIHMSLGWDADPGYPLGSSSRPEVAGLRAAFAETRSG